MANPSNLARSRGKMADKLMIYLTIRILYPNPEEQRISLRLLKQFRPPLANSKGL